MIRGPISLALAATLILGPVDVRADEDATASRCLDKTGMAWVLPFKTALMKAKAQTRLLMIKPIAYGTDSAGGWRPAAETLRAGPFSDERIVRLAGRRFIPFYFDLSSRGYAGDAAATKFVVAKQPSLGGPTPTCMARPTPPVLFMTSEGELLSQISNYATADQVLAKMREVLADHPKYAKQHPAEAKISDPVEVAELRVDLLDYEGAASALKGRSDAKSKYLLGRLARFRAHWDAMEKHFEGVTDESLTDDIRMEKAHRHWRTGAFRKLRRSLRRFPKESNRYTEARYHQGLALYHMGKKNKASKVWASTIKSCSQDPWIYRADWAYTQLKKSNAKGFSTSEGKRNSLLERIGYMGPGNPDLIGPPGDEADAAARAASGRWRWR